MNSTTPPPISRPRGRRGRGMRLPRSCYLLPKNCDLRPSRPRRPGGQKKPRPFSRGRPKSTPPLNQHQPAGKVTAVVCGTSRRPTAGLSNAPRCPPCLQHRGASRLVIDGQKFAISGHAFAGRLLNSEARDAGRCRGNFTSGRNEYQKLFEAIWRQADGRRGRPRASRQRGRRSEAVIRHARSVSLQGGRRPVYCRAHQRRIDRQKSSFRSARLTTHASHAMGRSVAGIRCAPG
jgi:hypothetical protein